jgi:hypothetical protein
MKVIYLLSVVVMCCASSVVSITNDSLLSEARSSRRVRAAANAKLVNFNSQPEVLNSEGPLEGGVEKYSVPVEAVVLEDVRLNKEPAVVVAPAPETVASATLHLAKIAAKSAWRSKLNILALFAVMSLAGAATPNESCDIRLRNDIGPVCHLLPHLSEETIAEFDFQLFRRGLKGFYLTHVEQPSDEALQYLRELFTMNEDDVASVQGNQELMNVSPTAAVVEYAEEFQPDVLDWFFGKIPFKSIAELADEYDRQIESEYPDYIAYREKMGWKKWE